MPPGKLLPREKRTRDGTGLTTAQGPWAAPIPAQQRPPRGWFCSQALLRARLFFIDYVWGETRPRC